MFSILSGIKNKRELTKLKKIICTVVVLLILIGYTPVLANAYQIENQEVSISERASGRFSVDISGGATVKAGTSFPLERGETVSINAVYTPQSASVDFGLLAPDGLFYPFNTTTGSFNKTIEVEERGNYTLVIRNNSSFEISVSGFVNY